MVNFIIDSERHSVLTCEVAHLLGAIRHSKAKDCRLAKSPVTVKTGQIPLSFYLRKRFQQPFSDHNVSTGQLEIGEIKLVMKFSGSPIFKTCKLNSSPKSFYCGNSRANLIIKNTKISNLPLFYRGRQHVLKMQKEFPYSLGVNDPPPTQVNPVS